MDFLQHPCFSYKNFNIFENWFCFRLQVQGIRPYSVAAPNTPNRSTWADPFSETPIYEILDILST
jgi:hypothetical protein